MEEERELEELARFLVELAKRLKANKERKSA